MVCSLLYCVLCANIFSQAIYFRPFHELKLNSMSNPVVTNIIIRYSIPKSASTRKMLIQSRLAQTDILSSDLHIIIFENVQGF